MKSLHWIVFVAVCTVAFAAVPPATTVASTKTTVASPKKKASSATRKSAPAARSGVTRRASVRTTQRTKGPARPAIAARQLTPTPERYKEIQQALVSKGYLKSDASGVWDAQSTDALRQFQTENNLSPTGKLSAASLKSLGLGARNNPLPVTPSGVPPVNKVDPPPPLPETPHAEPVPQP